ncbi:MAG: hypothetical protein QM541_09550 [Flavobacterium sp.]|nr:hypothetical protein [Flavobacterium sp.]
MATTNTTEKTQREHYDYKNIVTYITESKTALINAAQPDIAPKLAEIGYTSTEITAKLQELETLETLNVVQKKEYGEQYNATTSYTATENALHKTYINNLTIARVVFKNDVGAQVALALNGERKKSKSGYQAEALQFYKGILLNTTYKTALAVRGITEAIVTSQKTGFEGLSDLSADQKKETGEAQAATKKRDYAYDIFDEWMSDFKKMAIVALSDSPQLREKLGWKE